MGGACGAHTTFWLGGLKGGDHQEDLGVDGRITLRWILEGNRVWGCGLDSLGSG
jgi:hypothetical protein